MENLSLEDVKEAAKAFNGAIKHTPTEYSFTLSKITGAEVYLKFENRQFLGSKKIYGFNAFLKTNK